jgi:hypothetical protein
VDFEGGLAAFAGGDGFSDGLSENCELVGVGEFLADQKEFEGLAFGVDEFGALQAVKQNVELGLAGG